MDKINLSNSGLKISPLALGMWRIHEMSQKDRHNLLSRAFDMGITAFDHADIYGGYTCEEAFGSWMKANAWKREQIQLISKCGIQLITPNRPSHKTKHYDTSKAHIINSVDNSLQKLQTDYLDLLLIHRPDPLMDVVEIAETFQHLKEEGKVRFFGVSNFTKEQFELISENSDVPIITNQIEISLFQTAPMFDGTLDYLQKQGIRPMAWSPVGGAEQIKKALANQVLLDMAEAYGVAVGELLIMWLLRHPAGIVPVLGSSKPVRLKGVVSGYEKSVSRQDWFTMLEAIRGTEVP